MDISAEHAGADQGDFDLSFHSVSKGHAGTAPLHIASSAGEGKPFRGADAELVSLDGMAIADDQRLGPAQYEREDFNKFSQMEGSQRMNLIAHFARELPWGADSLTGLGPVGGVA
jgi:hypothetical protein